MPQIYTTKSLLEVVRYSEKWFHLLFIEISEWKLIALFYVQIMSSDMQNQLLQLILKSWYKPINKMDLPISVEENN